MTVQVTILRLSFVVVLHFEVHPFFVHDFTAEQQNWVSESAKRTRQRQRFLV